MPARDINGTEELRALIGQHLGYSDWVEITQEQVNQFAEATGDHQWIHVDVERAKAGPFGGPIAHGYLTLSLGPTLLAPDHAGQRHLDGRELRRDKVRFPSPVPVGSKLRLGATLARSRTSPAAPRCTMSFTFEVEGAAKPSCVAEVIFRVLTSRPDGLLRRCESDHGTDQRNSGMTLPAKSSSVSVSG